ncbi:hypothetical protein V6Z11_A11G324400 [Gossypium hirsutum]
MVADEERGRRGGHAWKLATASLGKQTRARAKWARTGGTGKTTLAEAIFYHLLNGFQSCFFLPNDENLYISTPRIGSGFIKDRISRKKVLIVCDDVSKNNRLGPGSRVIVTTRDKKTESVQLFCQRAFKSNHPSEYQLKLSKMVLSFANGNPLAITVFGTSLYGKDKNYQESAVKELKQIPNPDILKLLRSSFDGLNPVEKDIFLDIAGFLKREDLDFVRRLMDAFYGSAHSSIENLIDKSLISISQHKIEMHDLLQQMGRDIIYNESPSEPERRSRLWIPNDICDVLTENSDLGNLKVISLFYSKNLVRLSDLSSATNLEKIDLMGCSNLRVRLKSLPTSIHKLKSLEYFYAEGCSRLEAFPEILDTMEWLRRELNLSKTTLKELPSPIGNLIGLEKLVLNNCENLAFPEILDIMEWLRELNLSGTAKLVLSNCENFVCLPTNFYKLKSLEKFEVKGCSRLEALPEILDIMEQLRELNLNGTDVKELPSSIDNLIGLENLVLNNCENVVCLLDSFCCGDSNLLVKHTFTAIGLPSLKKLNLSESNLENLPTTIKQFPYLEWLILRKCTRLKSLPELPPSLVYLDAHDCTSLEDVKSIKKLFEQAVLYEDGRWLIV